jgi:hypothetical protein
VKKPSWLSKTPPAVSTPCGAGPLSAPPAGPRGPAHRRGLSLARSRSSTVALAPRHTPHQHPGPPLESPREAGPTFPAPRGTRQTRPGCARGHGPCVGGMPVGPGSRSPHKTVRLIERADSTTHSAGLPTCSGRDAAPVWCHPRRRAAAGRGHARRDRGRHPTEARQVGANPRRAAGSTVADGWLRLCRGAEAKNTRKT